MFDPDCQLLEFWGDETGYTLAVPTNPILRADYRADGHRAWKEVRGDNGEGDPERTYYLYDGDNPVVELDAQGRATAIMTWGLLGLISRDVRGADGASRGAGAGGMSSMLVDIRRLGMSTNFAVFVAPGAAPAGLPPAVAN